MVDKGVSLTWMTISPSFITFLYLLIRYKNVFGCFPFFSYSNTICFEFLPNMISLSIDYLRIEHGGLGDALFKELYVFS